MDTTPLENIGLTRGESAVYIVLSELGPTTSGPIAKAAGVSPSKVYPILERLISKGLAGVVIRGKTKYFEAASPEKLLGFLEEKKSEISAHQETITSLLPKLLMKRKAGAKVFLYEGLRSIKNMYSEISLTLKKGDEYIAYGISGSDSLRKAHAFFQNWQVERGRKGIRGKIVYEYDARDIAKMRSKAPLTEVRVMPKNFKTPAGINVYGDTTAIILWIESPLLIIIESPEVADSFREYFKLIWLMAKRPKS